MELTDKNIGIICKVLSKVGVCRSNIISDRERLKQNVDFKILSEDCEKCYKREIEEKKREIEGFLEGLVLAEVINEIDSSVMYKYATDIDNELSLEDGVF